MNRRSFLSGLAALVGGIALEEAIPFGRVWSFPKNIVIPKSKVSVTQVLGMMHEKIRPNLPLLYPMNDDMIYLPGNGKNVFFDDLDMTWWGEVNATSPG